MKVTSAVQDITDTLLCPTEMHPEFLGLPRWNLMRTTVPPNIASSKVTSTTSYIWHCFLGNSKTWGLRDQDTALQRYSNAVTPISLIQLWTLETQKLETTKWDI